MKHATCNGIVKFANKHYARVGAHWLYEEVKDGELVEVVDRVDFRENYVFVDFSGQTDDDCRSTAAQIGALCKKMVGCVDIDFSVMVHSPQYSYQWSKK